MNEKNLFIIFLIIVATSVVADAVQSEIWYVNIVLLAVFFAIERDTRHKTERGFYLLCGGEPMVIATGQSGVLFAIIIQLVLIMMFLYSVAEIKIRPFFRYSAAFSSFAILISLFVVYFRHAVVPLSVIIALSVISVILIKVSEFRLRSYLEGLE